MSEDIREEFQGRGKLSNFLRRYPFFFDVRTDVLGSQVEVRLRSDVCHPHRGAADEKFQMIDVGEMTHYVAKPEYIVSLEPLDVGSSSGSVHIQPPAPPPAIRVQLEERVPVLDRLRALVPVDRFVPIEELEEVLPEDLMFHPYFDCQGGLGAIAAKFPEYFQVVKGTIRLRPSDLSPLALGDFTLEESPLPEVAALIQREVCSGPIPHWVSLTPLYEKLSLAQRREIKKKFKSFAGFLRLHGRSLSISADMLRVALWIPPQAPSSSSSSRPANKKAFEDHSTKKGSEDVATNAASLSITSACERLSVAHPPQAASFSGSEPRRFRVYSRMQLVNILFERFPPDRLLSAREVEGLLPSDCDRRALPRRLVTWLGSFPTYFTLEENVPCGSGNQSSVLHKREKKDENQAVLDDDMPCIRRTSSRPPLDLALLLYKQLPEGEGGACSWEFLVNRLTDLQLAAVPINPEELVRVLPEWFELVRVEEMKKKNIPENALTEARWQTSGTHYIHPLRSLKELETALRSEGSKLQKREHQTQCAGNGSSSAPLEPIESILQKFASIRALKERSR